MGMAEWVRCGLVDSSEFILAAVYYFFASICYLSGLVGWPSGVPGQRDVRMRNGATASPAHAQVVTVLHATSCYLQVIMLQLTPVLWLTAKAAIKSAVHWDSPTRTMVATLAWASTVAWHFGVSIVAAIACSTPIGSLLNSQVAAWFLWILQCQGGQTSICLQGALILYVG